MALIGTEVLSDLFTFHVPTKTFVAEMSELGRRKDLFSRVYDDACDTGFVMVSTRTREKILCLWSGQKHDGEGELLYDRFLCCDLRGRPLSGRLGGAEVHLLND